MSQIGRTRVRSVAASMVLVGATALGCEKARGQASATASRPPEFTYLADGLRATLFREGPEPRLGIHARPVARAGIILQRRTEDSASLEFGLLRPGAEIVRFMQVHGDGVSIATDGDDALWLSVTPSPAGASSDGTTARMFVVQGLSALPRSIAKAPSVGVAGIALPQLAEGVTATVAAEVPRDPLGGGWQLGLQAGVASAESRRGLLRLREEIFEERGAQPGRVALDTLDPNGGWHPIAEAIIPWNERDGLEWMMPTLLASPDGAVWLGADQLRGSDRLEHVQQWVRIDGVQRALESRSGVLHDNAGQWSGAGYPPQQPSGLKPLLPGLVVKLVSSCASVELSGAMVSTLGLVVADKEPQSRVTFRLLTGDGKERDLLQVINMPEWAAAVDFDDVLWILSTPYQTGTMGSFAECTQLWRVDGLRDAKAAIGSGGP